MEVAKKIVLKDCGTTCIYHRGCIDGFGAAYSVWKALGGGVNYVGAAYGQLPPPIKDRRVIIVDFSYPRDVLLGIAKQANELILLDHHQTAEEELRNFPIGHIEIDQTKSGTRLAWEHFCKGQIPELLEYIEDYDLDRHAFVDTQRVILGLQCHPLDFEIWDALDLTTLRTDGAVIEKYYSRKVTEIVSRSFREIIGGYSVPVCNAPIFMANDVAKALAANEKFAASVWHTDEGTVYSLRSNKSGINVAKIALAYGGGGHKHCAGFWLPRHEALEGS